MVLAKNCKICPFGGILIEDGICNVKCFANLEMPKLINLKKSLQCVVDMINADDDILRLQSLSTAMTAIVTEMARLEAAQIQSRLNALYYIHDYDKMENRMNNILENCGVCVNTKP